MTRRRTPAERHERELDRMAPGGDYDASAPVRRQGPKGRVRVEPIVPSDELPEPVEEGDGGPGESGEFADREHDHPFVMATAAPAKVDPNGDGSAGTGPPAHEGHGHGLDLSAQLPTPVVDGPGSAGSTGQVPDAGHAHAFDLDTLTAGLAPSPHDNDHHSEPYATLTALTAHEGNTTTAHGASVSPAPSSIARRTSDGVVEGEDATAANHLVNRRTGDARFASLSALASHEGAEGSGTHGAISSATPGRIALRDANGNISVGDATNSGHATSRGFADGRYVEMSGDTMTGPLLVPAGSGASPGLEVGSGYGLYQAGTSLGIAAGGSGRFLFREAGIFPTAAGVSSLGSSGLRFDEALLSGLIETTASLTVAVSAPNGGVNALHLTGGDVMADPSFAGSNGQVLAGFPLGGTGVSDGRVVTDRISSYGTPAFVMDVKSGSFQVRHHDSATWAPAEVSTLTEHSDARSKHSIRPSEDDDLAAVLGTPILRFRRKVRKIRRLRPPSLHATDETHGPEWEALDELVPMPEEVGVVTSKAPSQIVNLMGDGVGGWDTGVDLGQSIFLLWHAFQQSHESLTARLDALEAR